jgi:hypothetical protein
MAVGLSTNVCDRPPGLVEWAFGPRNPMKNPAKPRDFPDLRSGFSTLSPVEACGAEAVKFSRSMNAEASRRGCSLLSRRDSAVDG